MRHALAAFAAFALVALIVPSFAPVSAPSAEVARRGCCSHHGGVCGCSGGRAQCCDGQLSPSCGCD
ncbi:MAG: hypothetical protein KC776_08820 [Myxococcales bacterium]|nr:hypothetical protein [Myxococcales bacterium]MCB9576326.1 hypothetical protein [Polyangiaceae bacterium]